VSTYSPLSTQDFLKTIYKKSGWILFLSLFVSASVTGISFLIPNQYKVTANLLPNEMRSISGLDLLSSGDGLSGIASSLLSGRSEESDQFIIFLESYTVNKAIIDEFKLIQRYDNVDSKTPIKHTLEELSKRTNFKPLPEGNFVIEVWDENPDTAVYMANAYISHLNRLNTEVSMKEATLYREFIETRYLQSETDLLSYQTQLRDFQQKYGVLELTAQIEANLTLIAELTAEKFQAELQKQYFGETVQENSPLLRNAEVQARLADDLINEITNNTDTSDFLLNYADVPQIGFEYFELMKRIEIETAIQQFIVPLYEQAKLEEAKSLPVVSVLDEPVAPERKSYPKRSLIAILSFISAIILISSSFIISSLLSKNSLYWKEVLGKE
jgi:LPS O-antigen subunit length determinant protein (WzzB/FepE family)